MRTYIIRFLPLAVLLTSFGPTAYANLALPDDGPYYRLRHGQTLYVYDASTRPFIEDVVGYNARFREMYDRSFGWRLDEEQDLILLSPRQQVSNAVATQYPNVKSYWYGSGAGLLGSVASSSWLTLLASHETSHLYQMNVKSGVGTALKSVLGNSLVFSALGWPITLRPTELLSHSFAEGNAVLNESRLNQGGRLYSGELRALILRMVAAGEVDATRLINHEFKYPFDHANYVLGMYFQAHLAAKHGIDLTNRFFRAHAERWLNPLRLNQTFRTHFGTTFYQEAREFERGLERLAAQQKITPGVPLARTLRVNGLNHDADRVWWLTNPGYSTSTLHVFDRRTREIRRRTVDLPMISLNFTDMRTFFLGERPVVASSWQNDLHHITYGLFSDGAHLEDEGRGEIVTDRRAGHRVGFDARNAWRDPHVVLDGEPYDVAHSNPRLDEAGHVWYFRQSGRERLLYRDRQIVGKIRGWYSNLTEVDADGTAYFIAATKFGSSLFAFARGEVKRVLDSDAVLDARKIDGGQFLVVEPEARGSRLIVADANLRREEPEVYAYPFASEDLTVKPALSAAEVARDEKPYHATRELRFSALDFNVLFSSFAGLATGVAANFNDPLEFTALSGAASYSPRGTRRASAEYSYSRFLPQVFARYDYGDYLWLDRDGDRRTIDQQASLGTKVRLLRHDRWNAALRGSLVYEREGADYESDRTRDTVGVFSTLGLGRYVPSEIGMYPWRDFNVVLTGRVLEEPGARQTRAHAGSLLVRWDHGFKDEYYVSATGQVARADHRSIDVGNGVDLLPNTIGLSRLTMNPLMAVRGGARGQLEVRKVAATRLYDDRIPLGLNRLAVVATGQALALEQSGAGRAKSLLEYGYGFDFEFLVLHQSELTMRILATHTSDVAADTPDQITIGAAGAF